VGDPTDQIRQQWARWFADASTGVVGNEQFRARLFQALGESSLLGEMVERMTRSALHTMRLPSVEDIERARNRLTEAEARLAELDRRLAQLHERLERLGR
jgi:hypothetical protein